MHYINAIGEGISLPCEPLYRQLNSAQSTINHKEKQTEPLNFVKIKTMDLHLAQAGNNNLITAYGDGYIEVNKKRYKQTIIVMAETLVLDWPVEGFKQLTETHFENLLKLNPEVILLGTGNKHHFIHPKLISKLTEKNIAVECMSTDAACRTYNILMNEGRNVAAALLLK